MKKQKITIYTDGSSLGNPGKGGWAAILSDESQNEKILTGGFRLTTNNRMELLAIVEGLKSLKVQGYSVIIYTDSQLISNSVNNGWLKKWSNNGWKKSDKTEVLNSDLWKMLIELMKINNVQVSWIKGHNGEEGNERCDKLSKNAAENATAIDEFYENGTQNNSKQLFIKPQQSVLENHKKSHKLLENHEYSLYLSNNSIIIKKKISSENTAEIIFEIGDKEKLLHEMNIFMNKN